ncbi:GNAT family N-acetyltransferase [Proteobacteria bacterium 005FR1]|nr:GNAT family N-acetyltransferase [Proteobacteria bacterium 005FR1]
MYDIREQIPGINEYIELRLQAGLSKKSEEAAARGLPNTIYSVLVYADGSPVGMGRIVGDGGCFYQITDMAVLPIHQRRGVGAMIMRALVGYLEIHAPHTAYVSLMADHGTPGFYRKFGFVPTEMPYAAGMYMRIKRNQSSQTTT